MRDRFQLDFLQLLDGRLDTIERNIGTRHYEEARIAMLSLEAASGMLGAQQLVDRLRELRGIVDFGPAQLRTDLMTLVRSDAGEVRRALEDGDGLDTHASVL